MNAKGVQNANIGLTWARRDLAWVLSTAPSLGIAKIATLGTGLAKVREVRLAKFGLNCIQQIATKSLGETAQSSAFYAPDLQCWVSGRCDGTLLQESSVDASRECLQACKEEEGCEWFTYDFEDGACLLYTDCLLLDTRYGVKRSAGLSIYLLKFRM